MSGFTILLLVPGGTYGGSADLELPVGRIRYPANASMRHLVRPLVPRVSYRAGVLEGRLAGR